MHPGSSYEFNRFEFILFSFPLLASSYVPSALSPLSLHPTLPIFCVTVILPAPRASTSSSLFLRLMPDTISLEKTPCPFMPLRVPGANCYRIKYFLFRALMKMYFPDCVWSHLFNIFLPNKASSFTNAGAGFSCSSLWLENLTQHLSPDRCS